MVHIVSNNMNSVTPNSYRFLVIMRSVGPVLGNRVSVKVSMLAFTAVVN